MRHSILFRSARALALTTALSVSIVLPAAAQWHGPDRYRHGGDWHHDGGHNNTGAVVAGTLLGLGLGLGAAIGSMAAPPRAYSRRPQLTTGHRRQPIMRRRHRSITATDRIAPEASKEDPMSLKSTTHAVLLATLVLPSVALAQAVPPTSGAPGAAPPVVAPASLRPATPRRRSGTGRVPRTTPHAWNSASRRCIPSLA